MNKNFIFVLVIILIGITAWLFIPNNPENLSAESKTTSSTVDNPSSQADINEPKVTTNEWIKLENGLQHQDIVVGSGQEAKAGDMVSAHYLGTFENGIKFDSSYDRGEPFVFLLGAGQVIKGWDIGIVGMKTGGKRKLVIPSELGYGERGAGGGAIPPNSTLYFEVELVAVQTSLVEQ